MSPGALSPGFWTFETAGRLVFGPGAVGRLGRLASELDLRRVLIVSDEALVEAGHVGAVSSALVVEGVKVDAFTGGEPEPSIEVALAAAGAAARFEPRAILGLGGGSNLDLAKIVALLAQHGGSPHDYFGAGNVPGPVLPIVAIPTTAGTGSEVSNSAVLTDTDKRIKVSTVSNHLRPALAVVDPELAFSCPDVVTAGSGIDALTHAIEAFTLRDNRELQIAPSGDPLPPYFGRHALGSALAGRAIGLVGRHLRRAVEKPRNRAAREGMALAATLAGMAFSNCGVALVHALEYPLGGATGCPHGQANGLLLPHVMRFNRPACAPQLARVAELLGESTAGLSEAEAADRAVTAVERLRDEIGIPARLRELGAREDQLPQFAADAFQIKRLLAVNPRPPSEGDLLEILQAAF